MSLLRKLLEIGKTNLRNPPPHTDVDDVNNSKLDDLLHGHQSARAVINTKPKLTATKPDATKKRRVAAPKASHDPEVSPGKHQIKWQTSPNKEHSNMSNDEIVWLMKKYGVL